MKITHLPNGKVEFEPSEFQKELIENIVNQGKNVVVKSARQMGTSTTMCYCVKELCLRNPGYKALVVGCNSEAVNEKISLLSNEIKRRTKYKIEFENGSEIRFLPGSPIIGEVLDEYEVFFDNYEFISKKLLECLFPCFSENGFKPRFYSFTGNNDFEREGFEVMKWNWTLNPNRDDKWFEEQKRLLGEKLAKQEYEVN